MNFKKYVGQLLKASLIPFIYYFDIFADSIFLYDLGVNCHWRYLSISLFILSVSYISTVFYLKFRLLLSWKRSLLYPHYHSKDIFRRLWIALRGKLIWKSKKYIYISNIVIWHLPVWIPGSGWKPTSRPLPGAYNTSLEPSRQKKLIHEKKSCFTRAACPQRAKTRSAH